MPTTVFIVEAEHFSVPGRIVRVFATFEAATSCAVSLANEIGREFASGWEDVTSAEEFNCVMQEQDEHDCYVNLAEYDLEACG